MADAEQARVVPVFKSLPRLNKAKSATSGRPIFDDREVVEVRFAANRQTVGVFPAHAFCRQAQNLDGSTEPQTYAQRWPDQYRRFKENKQQVQEGTPLEELPFLTQAKRMELKALSILTAESLAALDGQELKNLGQGGRELKNQAAAYIDAASGSADVTRLSRENEELRAQLKMAQNASAQANDGDGDDAAEADEPKEGDGDEFEGMTPEELKAYIKDRTGETPRGNPSKATLVAMATEAKG